MNENRVARKDAKNFLKEYSYFRKAFANLKAFA